MTTGMIIACRVRYYSQQPEDYLFCPSSTPPTPQSVFFSLESRGWGGFGILDDWRCDRANRTDAGSQKPGFFLNIDRLNR
ncbi:hypothetical protein [Limnofasciculus baicalensis]|uniref:Uncharacterized protein n=1 Tax=Limnofasciculus baicalensis BBK-W-15 TaxID=2699891 RepID=A0AAE3GM99_9CYAN|nr:hypothetical protein [Limnofasciculus baicalensis]MCP2726979.1 hypothetical protein [Limnofasciculus baicalensis BBK-W-15]